MSDNGLYRLEELEDILLWYIDEVTWAELVINLGTPTPAYNVGMLGEALEIPLELIRFYKSHDSAKDPASANFLIWYTKNNGKFGKLIKGLKKLRCEDALRRLALSVDRIKKNYSNCTIRRPTESGDPFRSIPVPNNFDTCQQNSGEQNQLDINGLTRSPTDFRPGAEMTRQDRSLSVESNEKIKETGRYLVSSKRGSDSDVDRQSTASSDIELPVERVQKAKTNGGKLMRHVSYDPSATQFMRETCHRSFSHDEATNSSEKENKVSGLIIFHKSWYFENDEEFLSGFRDILWTHCPGIWLQLGYWDPNKLTHSPGNIAEDLNLSITKNDFYIIFVNKGYLKEITRGKAKPLKLHEKSCHVQYIFLQLKKYMKKTDMLGRIFLVLSEGVDTASLPEWLKSVKTEHWTGDTGKLTRCVHKWVMQKKPTNWEL